MIPEDFAVAQSVQHETDGSSGRPEFTVHLRLKQKDYYDGYLDFSHDEPTHCFRGECVAVANVQVMAITVFPGPVRDTLWKSPWRALFLRGNDWETPRARERAALEALFVNLHGPSWARKAGWEEMPVDLSKLEGVSINFHGQVTDIRLPENHLESTTGLPDVFDGLPELRRLDLSGNILLGKRVCPSLLRLPMLESLNLVETKLVEWPGMRFGIWFLVADIQWCYIPPPPSLLFVTAAICLARDPYVFPSLNHFGGKPCDRGDLCSLLSLYVASGGTSGVWFRLSPLEWSPNLPIVHTIAEPQPEPQLGALNGVQNDNGTGSLEEQKGHMEEGTSRNVEVEVDALTAAPGKEGMSWPGVYFRDNRVVTVKLPSGGLAWGSRQFPAGLGQSDAIEILDLRQAGITGRLPNDVFFLKNLKVLNLSANRLSGSLPGALLGAPTLQKLAIEWRDHGGLEFDMTPRTLFEDVPTWISDIPKQPALLQDSAVPKTHLAYHMPDGVITLELSKYEVLRGILNERSRLKGRLVFHPLMDPISRAFFLLSAIIVVTDMFTDALVAAEFALNGDWAWFTVSVACMGIYAFSSAWFTAVSLGSRSVQSFFSAFLSAIGFGGLTEVIQLILNKPVKLNGLFSINQPFKVTLYLASLHFLEATMESLPQLILQLYVRATAKFEDMSLIAWLSLFVSFVSVLRIIVIQDREVLLSSAHVASAARRLERQSGKSGQQLGRSFTAKGGDISRHLLSSLSVNPKASSAGSDKADQSKQPTKTKKVLQLLESQAEKLKEVPSLSLLGTALLLVRMIEVLASSTATVIIGLQFKEYLFVMAAGWIILYVLVMLIPLSYTDIKSRKQAVTRVTPLSSPESPPDVQDLLQQSSPQTDPSPASPNALMPKSGQWKGKSFRKRLWSLTFTAFATSALMWLFNIAPAFLIPRFLPTVGLRAWKRPAIVTATILLLLKDAALFAIALLYYDSVPIIGYVALVACPLAALSTIMLSMVSARKSWTRMCLLTGVWCDYDILVDGEAKSDTQTLIKELIAAQNEVRPSQQSRKWYSCRRRRRVRQKREHDAR